MQTIENNSAVVSLPATNTEDAQQNNVGIFGEIERLRESLPDGNGEVEVRF